MTQSCRKPVYRTMCETDKGVRHGKHRGVRYESTPKRNQTTRKTKATGTAKAVPKAITKTTKKDDAIWKSMDKRMFDDDRPTEYNYKLDEHLDKLDDTFGVAKTKTNKGYKDADERRIQEMYLQDAWMKRQASKRKKYTGHKSGGMTSLDSQIFLSDRKEDFYSPPEPDENDLESDYETYHQRAFRDEELRKAYVKRRTAKRKPMTKQTAKKTIAKKTVKKAVKRK